MIWLLKSNTMIRSAFMRFDETTCGIEKIADIPLMVEEEIAIETKRLKEVHLSLPDRVLEPTLDYPHTILDPLPTITDPLSITSYALASPSNELIVLPQVSIIPPPLGQ